MKTLGKYYLEWFKRFVDISSSLGCESIGSHFAILTQDDLDDSSRRDYLTEHAVKSWQEISSYAKK